MKKLDKVKSTGDVSLVVAEGNLGRLPYSLEASEMNTGREGIELEDSLEGDTVEEIYFVKDERASRVVGEDLGSVKGFLRGVAEVVDDDEVFAEVEELNDGV